MAEHARQRAQHYPRPECLRRLLAAYEQTILEFQPRPAVSDAGWTGFVECPHIEWMPVWEKLTIALARRQELPAR